MSSSSPATDRRLSGADWIHRALPSAADNGGSASPKASGGKRFVEPYRLSDEQRLAVLSSLDQRQIGDEETRTLFTASLEYGLAICHRLAVPADPLAPPAKEHPPDEEDPAVAALTEAALSLALQLQSLDAAARRLLRREIEGGDRFQRHYGEEYLRSLDRELRCFADIGKPLAQNAPSVSDASAPEEDARRFVLHAADAFEDCFELASDTDPDSPFLATLEAIVAVVGIAIPTDPATLNRILDHDWEVPPRARRAVAQQTWQCRGS